MVVGISSSPVVVIAAVIFAAFGYDAALMSIFSGTAAAAIAI